MPLTGLLSDQGQNSRFDVAHLVIFMHLPATSNDILHFFLSIERIYTHVHVHTRISSITFTKYTYRKGSLPELD